MMNECCIFVRANTMTYDFVIHFTFLKVKKHLLSRYNYVKFITMSFTFLWLKTFGGSLQKIF